MPVEREDICWMLHFLPLAKQIANVRPGQRTRSPLVGFALELQMQGPKKKRHGRDHTVHSDQRSPGSSFGLFD